MKCCEGLCLSVSLSRSGVKGQGAPEPVRLCPGLSGVVLVWFSPGLRCRCLRAAGRLA